MDLEVTSSHFGTAPLFIYVEPPTLLRKETIKGVLTLILTLQSYRPRRDRSRSRFTLGRKLGEL